MEPLFEIFMISLGISIFTQVVNRFFSDPARAREISKKLQAINKELMTAHKDGDHHKVEKLKKEQTLHMNTLMEVYKQMFTPLLITLVPLLIVFKVIEGTYAPLGVIINLFGMGLNWFWTYFLFALVCSLMVDRTFRKIWK
jgi:uncharacterized membrane protein (DUF106 family)